MKDWACGGGSPLRRLSEAPEDLSDANQRAPPAVREQLFLRKFGKSQVNRFFSFEMAPVPSQKRKGKNCVMYIPGDYNSCFLEIEEGFF